MQGNLQDGEKVLANHIPDKGLVVKIQKEFLQFNSKKTNKLILKLGKRLD